MAGYRKRKRRTGPATACEAMTTLVTPFTAGDRLDEDGLRANMRYIRSLGTSRRGLHLGHGRVLEPHARRAAPRL